MIGDLLAVVSGHREREHKLVCKKKEDERVVDRQSPLGADRA